MGTHHIVSDGWSTDLLLRDLAGTYRALAAGTTPRCPPPPVRYGDFAALAAADRLTGRGWTAELDYWREHAAPGCRRWSCRPTGPARPPQTFDGAWHWFTLDRELAAGLAAARPRARRDPVHDAAGRVPGAAVPVHRAGRLRGRLAGRRAAAARAGGRRRHVHQHAAAAGRAGRRPDLRRAARADPRHRAGRASPTRRCRSNGWSTRSACPATSAGRRCSRRCSCCRTTRCAGRRRRPGERTADGLPVELRGDPVRPGAARGRGPARRAAVPVRLQHRAVRAGHHRPDGRAPARAAARRPSPTRTGQCPQLDSARRRTSARCVLARVERHRRRRRRRRDAAGAGPGAGRPDPGRGRGRLDEPHPDLRGAGRARPTGSRTGCAARGVGPGDAGRRSAPSASPSWSSACSACSRPARRTCRWTRTTRPSGSPSCSPTRPRRSC